MQITEDQIIALHKKYAPTHEVFNLVFVHCRIVEQIASQLIGRKSLSVDRQLTKVGALLHDIGVYRLFDTNGVETDPEYIKHGLLGYKILKDEGFPEAVCRFASCHTGVGLTDDDIVQQKLPLPLGDYIARSAEERLVMFGDKFHSKTTPPMFNTAAWYAEYVARFGEEKKQIFLQMAAEFGEPDVSELSAKYGHAIRN